MRYRRQVYQNLSYYHSVKLFQHSDVSKNLFLSRHSSVSSAANSKGWKKLKILAGTTVILSSPLYYWSKPYLKEGYRWYGYRNDCNVLQQKAEEYTEKTFDEQTARTYLFNQVVEKSDTVIGNDDGNYKSRITLPSLIKNCQHQLNVLDKFKSDPTWKWGTHIYGKITGKDWFSAAEHQLLGIQLGLHWLHRFERSEYERKRRYYRLAYNHLRSLLAECKASIEEYRTLHSDAKVAAVLGKTLQEWAACFYRADAKIARIEQDWQRGYTSFNQALLHVEDDPLSLIGQARFLGDQLMIRKEGGSKHTLNSEEKRKITKLYAALTPLFENKQFREHALLSASWLCYWSAIYAFNDFLADEESCLDVAWSHANAAVALQTMPSQSDSTWHPTSYMQRGLIAEMQGCYDDAISDFKQVIKIKPDYPLAWQYAGKAYYQKAKQLRNLNTGCPLAFEKQAYLYSSCALFLLAYHNRHRQSPPRYRLLVKKTLVDRISDEKPSRKSLRDIVDSLECKLEKTIQGKVADCGPHFKAVRELRAIVESLPYPGEARLTQKINAALSLLSKQPGDIVKPLTDVVNKYYPEKVMGTDNKIRKASEKAYADYISQLELDNVTLPKAYIEMCRQTYQKELHTQYFVPKWQCIARSDDNTEIAETGYHCFVYRHVDTKQLAFAHRGTDPLSIQDLQQDFELMLGKVPDYVTYAKRWQSTVLNEFSQQSQTDTAYLDPKIRADGYNKALPIIHVGHSLGGAIATCLVSISPDRTRGIVFDSPGMHKQVTAICTQSDHTFTADTVPITSYVARPNFVNTWGKQVGQVVFVEVVVPEYYADPRPITLELLKLGTKSILRGFLKHYFHLSETDIEAAKKALTLMKDFSSEANGRYTKKIKLIRAILKQNLAAHNADAWLAAFADNSRQIYTFPNSAATVIKWPSLHLSENAKIIFNPWKSEWFRFEKALLDVKFQTGVNTDSYNVRLAMYAHKAFRDKNNITNALEIIRSDANFHLVREDAIEYSYIPLSRFSSEVQTFLACYLKSIKQGKSLHPHQQDYLHLVDRWLLDEHYQIDSIAGVKFVKYDNSSIISVWEWRAYLEKQWHILIHPELVQKVDTDNEGNSAKTVAPSPVERNLTYCLSRYVLFKKQSIGPQVKDHKTSKEEEGNETVSHLH